MAEIQEKKRTYQYDLFSPAGGGVGKRGRRCVHDTVVDFEMHSHTRNYFLYGIISIQLEISSMSVVCLSFSRDLELFSQFPHVPDLEGETSHPARARARSLSSTAALVHHTNTTATIAVAGVLRPQHAGHVSHPAHPRLLCPICCHPVHQTDATTIAIYRSVAPAACR